MVYSSVDSTGGSAPEHNLFVEETSSAIASGRNDSSGEAMDISIGQKMLSAVTGSILTSVLVTPLDVVRVRLQAQSHPMPSTPVRAVSSDIPLSRFSNLPPNLGISACCREVFWINNNTQYCVAGPTIAPTLPQNSSCAAEEVKRTRINSTLDGLRKIARHEGPKTLWRGLSPMLAMSVPANVIYLAGYDWLRTSPHTPFRDRVPDAYAPLVAGSSARVLAAMVVSPLEMFRTRMQAATHASTTTGVFSETFVGMKDMVKAQGIRSLWTGLTLTLWRDVPFSAIYWWGYETGRNIITDARGRAEARRDGLEFSSGHGQDKIRRRSRSRSHERHTTTLIDSSIAGAVSGSVAAFITTPFDVGKTRQQIVRDGGGGSSISRPESKSMPRFLWYIFKEQGLPGLFRGWAPRVMKVAPACAIMISSYEVGKKMASSANELRDIRRNA